LAERHLFTSESVCMGHPDKVADQISDAVLDAMLTDDPMSRVACETLVTTGLVLVAGEITTKTYVDIPALVRRTIRDIGYTDPSMGFHYETCAVITTIDKQSPDIAMGVDTGGAGDQGLMFGYACRDTKEFMPLPIALAHAICERLAVVRQKGILPYLRPDGKAQVTVEYEGRKPVRVHTVVCSNQHLASVQQARIRRDILKHVIQAVIPARLLDKDTIYHVNPTGRFVVGGPHADCGVTGRKIIVDTYGGKGSHGGGAFSGKDPSKVDRSASYMARHVAKNIVAAGLADEIEVQVAYAIGVADPVSVTVDTFGTSRLSDAALVKLIRKVFPLTPKGIIEYLNLRRPIYQETARHGHFGRRHPNFTWEETNRVDDILKVAKKLK
jgi:S-adenosylmethionine synthetase